VANREKQGRAPRRAVWTILKVLYLLVFLAAAAIVVLYIVYKAAVKPPAVELQTQLTVTVRPSDDPDTPDLDESQLTDGDPEVTTLQLTRKEQFYTFLLMGSDDGNGNADTIMVGAFDVKNGKLSVVSVPRDTLVDVSRSVKKINAAYGAGGFGESGVEQLLDELTGVLGFRPDHYIKVDIQAFVDVVNALGGVSFYVPCDMYHNDGAGFIINLKQGTQWLDGDKALQLVRYRGYANADLGRIQTQQKFLQQLAKQTLSLSSVTKVNEFARILSQYFDTDLSVTELAYFGTAALSLDFSSDLTFATLPGDGTVSYKGVSWYYQLEPEGCLEILNSTVNPYTTDITDQMTDILQVK
jgi:LCP family protein required for cell wall assembly